MYIKKNMDISKITNNIYLGGILVLESRLFKKFGIIDESKIYKYLGITDVINISSFIEVVPKNINILQIYIDDKPSENILRYFDKTNKFIDNALKNKNKGYLPESRRSEDHIDQNRYPKIYIHCYAGMS